eukprot:gene5870-7302_t
MKSIKQPEKKSGGLPIILENKESTSPIIGHHQNNNNNNNNNDSSSNSILNKLEIPDNSQKIIGSPISRLRKGSLPLPSLYAHKDLNNSNSSSSSSTVNAFNTAEAERNKHEKALQRRNSRTIWGTMHIPGLDILQSDLIRVKEESNSRLLLFISDMKRSIRESKNDPDRQKLFQELLEVAQTFVSTNPNQVETGKFAEDLLKKLNDKEKYKGANREKIINLLIIISNFGRLKEFLSIEKETEDTLVKQFNNNIQNNQNNQTINNNINIVDKQTTISLPTSPPESPLILEKKPIISTSKPYSISSSSSSTLIPPPKFEYKQQPTPSIPISKNNHIYHDDQQQQQQQQNTLIRPNSPVPVKPPLLSRRILDILHSKKHKLTSQEQEYVETTPQQNNNHLPTPTNDFIPIVPENIKNLPDKKTEKQFVVIDNDIDEEFTPIILDSPTATTTTTTTTTTTSPTTIDEETFTSSSESESDETDTTDDDDDQDPEYLQPYNENDIPVFLLDPRVKELKKKSDGPISKRPLVRSKSFSPNKVKEIVKEKTFKKLTRSFSEIPSIKVLETAGQQQMAICRICEDRINSSLLEEHSKICAVANQEDMKAMNVEDHIRAISKILLNRCQNLPSEKRKPLMELREIAHNAVEYGTRECNQLLTDLRDKINKFDLEDENRVLALKIDSLISEKISALKKAEEVINSSPRIFRTNSPRVLQSPRSDMLDYPIGGRHRSDSDPTQSMDVSRPKGIPTINDFQIIKPITKGGFGKVYLSKKKRTGDIYAIKRLKKSDMIKKNQVDHVKIERNILAYTSNPFVVKIKVGLLDRQTLVPPSYFSPKLGSQNAPKKAKKMLPLSLSKKLALSSSSPSISSQSNNQENPTSNPPPPSKSPSPMLGGLSGVLNNNLNLNNNNNNVSNQPPQPINPNQQHQQINSLPSTTTTAASATNQKPSRKLSCVGTPDYLAPEILLGIGHGNSVDWFAVGVILYEFLVGIPPFSAQTVESIFQNILQRNIKWPKDISPEAKDFIDKLLALNPQSRLGYNGAQEVKDHPFFKGINWSTIRTQKAFFIPVLEDLQDTSYFDARKQFYDLRISDDSESSSNITENEYHNKFFDDFLYVNFQSLSELNQNYLAETKPYVISRKRNSL